MYLLTEELSGGVPDSPVLTSEPFDRLLTHGGQVGGQGRG